MQYYILLSKFVKIYYCINEIIAVVVAGKQNAFDHFKITEANGSL